MSPHFTCPECGSENGPEFESASDQLSRRDFLCCAAAAASALSCSSIASPGATVLAAQQLGEKSGQNPTKKTKPPETIVKLLYDSLTEQQQKAICFDWNHQDSRRGLLRTRISNNWHITRPVINSAFYTSQQRSMIRDIFEGIIQPEWHARIDKQLKDDAGGFGKSQNIAIFGKPGDGKFELVMTGRHMTLRCDGDSTEHVAFGGPIFYGHAASGFYEKPGHPGNVYWEQALEANKVYEMLDGKQRQQAEVAVTRAEDQVGFRGFHGKSEGIPVSELSADQKEQVRKTLQKLIEPYRQCDRDEVVACLKAQGGLDKCSLTFYTDDDLGKDRVWDNWRLEGPSFVWHFRGVPHVHVWVNVADDPSVKLNA